MKVVSEMFTSGQGMLAPFEMRNRLLNSYIFTFAICGHILFIPVFFLLNRDIPFYNNLFSVMVDAFCIYMNSRWKLRTVFCVFAIEISLHTFFCNIIFGWQAGFIFYYFAITSYIFLIRKYSTVRVVAFSILVVLFITQYLFIESSPPSYPATVIPVWLIFYLNVIANFAAIAVVSAQFSIFVDHAEDVIFKAKIRAEEGERAKSVFLANMSHEIRSPLNSIIGMINLSMLSGDDDEKNEYLYTAKSSAEHLLTVINDILDYSKIEVSRMSLNIETFNIHHLVRNTMMAMDSSIYNRKLEMNYEIHDSVPVSVKGDPSRIRQVLINLISNAVKFTESGSITLRCGIVTDSSPFIEFSVEDTGVGIPADKIDTVFDRFTQLEWKSAKPHNGTGLGLAISRELVELMEGKISVESTPGKGSIFIFRIPLHGAESEETKNGDNQISNPVGAHGPLHVLIAEDIFTNWLLYEKYMNILGHSFKIVENGCMVLDELEQNSYDLVLMDLEMPEMGGEEALRIIRSGNLAVDKDIPVIALSGHSINDMNKKGNTFNGVVTKPVDLDVLERTIYDVIYGTPGELYG